MNEVVQKINIKEVVDVRDALKDINSIKDALGKLSLPTEVQDTFDKLFTKLEKQAEKANAALATGFKNKGDVKKYSDAMNQIVNVYDEIIKKTNTLSKTKKINIAADDTDLKNALKDLKDLQEEQEKAAKKLNSVQKSTSSTLSKAAKNHQGKNSAAAWNDAVKAFEDGKIEDTEKALKRLNTQVKIAESRAQKNGTTLSSDWVKYKEDVENMTAALDEYKDAAEKEAVAQDAVNTKQKEADAYYNKGAAALQNISNAAQSGAQGVRSFAKGTEESAKQTQELNSELENFKSKAAYFFGLSNAINLFKRSVRSAYETVKDLDAVMTETAVVTNFDVGDMWTQLPEYTQRANELGVSIHSAYEAATIFYQQGLKTNEVMAVSNETLKMARIAGLDAATASDRMTNALRGFNMEMDKVSAQRVNDVYSKLAAITASNTDEISTAMTKVASLAHNANMEFETTSAFLAQIIESTRESAETAGTALKTVVARFSEVKKLYSKGQLMGNDEEGEAIDVNKVSTALRSAGINLNEYLTGSKGLDDIFIELAEKWDSLDKVQQRYIATMAAGSRQQSRFIALMSDYKRTVELVDAANNANGASQEQYGKTLDSLETKLARLKNAWDEFILGLTNSDAIKGAVDLLTSLITTINKLISAISGKSSAAKMITTFFAAFGAFKIGQNAIGKNGMLTAFFGKLTGNAEITAKTSASEIAKLFYGNLAGKIANFQQQGNFTGAFRSIGNSLKDSFNGVKDYFLPNTDEIKEKLFNSLDPKLSNEEFDKLWAQLDSGKLTVGEFNSVLEQNGQNFRIDSSNAQEFGLVLGKDTEQIGKLTSGMKIASVACIALGGALVAFGDHLEQQEGSMSIWGTRIKALGTGLITFGTIMSVYIPLRAQMMAQGVTGAIMSIPIVGVIAGVIAALTALGVAIYNISKNNSIETKLEKANDDLKAVTEAAEDAKKAYEDLGAAWEDLGNKYDIIEKATQGTKEWKEAVRQVNEAVLQLANTYDNVKISRDEEGILHITNQQEVDDSLAEQVANNDAATRMTKIRNLELKRQKDLIELSKSMEYGHIAEDLYKSGDLQGFNNKTKDEIKQLIVSKYGEDYVSDEEIERMQKFALDTSNTDELVNSQKTAFGASIMENAGLSKEERKYANAFLNNNYIDKQIRDTQKEIEDNWSEDKIKNEYARSKGEIDYKTYKAKNPDDNTSLEGMKDSIIGTEVLKKGTEQTIDFINRLNTLSDEEKALFAGESGKGLTQEDYNKLSNANFDKTSLYYKTGGSEVWGDQDAFNKWFEESLKNAFNNFDLSNFGEEFKSKLDTELVKNLDSDTYKNLVNNLSSVYSSSGKEGMEIVQNTIKGMAEKVGPDKMNSFINSLNSIDWSNADSIQNLEDLTKQYGISEKEIKRLKDQIIEFNNATNKVDFEKFSEIIGLLQKIANGEQGRSFTAEQYEQLLANGVKPDDFSYNSATNTYDYKGADVQELVTGIVKRLDSEITQLGKQSNSNQAVEKSIDAYGTNLTDVSKMRQFLFTYNRNAGKDSLVNLDMLRNGSDEQIRLAYKQVMDTYSKQSDIEQDQDQAKALRYQMSTGSELSEVIKNTGDTGAIDALASKLIAAGLPKDLVDGLMPYVTSGNGVVKGGTDTAGNLVDITNEAKQFGISVEDLNTYAAALRSVKGLEDERADTLYRLALANARYQDGIKKLGDTYDEWIKLKQKDGSIRANNGDPAQLKAYEQLKKTLKEVLNTSKDISDEFLEAPENVALIEKAAKGDAKAISQLRANMAKVDLSKLGIKPQALDEIYSKIDEFAKNAPDLKFGATLDDSKYAQTLAEMLEQAGLTGEEMEEVFKQIGWSPEIEYVAMDWEDVQKQNTSGWQEIMHPDGTKEKVPVDGLSEYAVDGKVMVPRFGKGTKFVKPTKPAGGNKNKKKKAGGGGSKKSTKKSYWENPYDELYNLQQKINEALRTRESLERRYQKLLKQEQATLEDIRKSYYAQITNLRSEANLQKQFAEGRLRQISQLGNKIYTDENGKRKTFKSLGVTKYASYNADTGLLTIDWEGLEKISKNSKRTNEGKAAEAYISKLEELVGSYEEVRDKLWSIEDEIENLRQTAIESYLSFEDRVMESLVTKYQQQIDSYQAMSDALDKANNEVISSLREQVDLSRQIRDNTEKENEISDMENRLAYLQRDTSGANALEVQKLQKDLEDAREGYTDTLIDQAIDKIQKDADVAAEQRARQIETMTEQLEIMKNTGALWQQVYDLIDEAGDGNGALSSQSNLVELLKKSEAFASLSNIGQEKWWSEVAEQFHAAWVGRGESEDKYKRDANNDGTINNTDTQDTIDSVAQTATTVQPTAATTVNHTDKDKYGVALAVSEGSYGWGVGETRTKNLKAKGFNPDEIQAIINKVANDVMAGTWSGKYYGIKDLNPYKLSKFKQGGLADFTGPAWLDGTKTRPELILNAQDSRNFITLKDILASLMSSSSANGGIINEAKQVNVDIQATIQGDYDVDRMVERVKKDIYDDGQYRNVNSISFLR